MFHIILNCHQSSLPWIVSYKLATLQFQLSIKNKILYSPKYMTFKSNLLNKFFSSSISEQFYLCTIIVHYYTLISRQWQSLIMTNSKLFEKFKKCIFCTFIKSYRIPFECSSQFNNWKRVIKCYRESNQL